MFKNIKLEPEEYDKDGNVITYKVKEYHAPTYTYQQMTFLTLTMEGQWIEYKSAKDTDVRLEVILMIYADHNAKAYLTAAEKAYCLLDPELKKWCKL